jgi:hypothetical protein
VPDPTAAALTTVFAAADEKRDVMEPLRQLARRCGWLTYHAHRSDHSEAGFPDLVFVRCSPYLEPIGWRARPLVLFVECKREAGKLTSEQIAWRQTLKAIERATGGLVAYRLAKPSTRWEIDRLLTGQPTDQADKEDR